MAERADAEFALRLPFSASVQCGGFIDDEDDAPEARIVDAGVCMWLLSRHRVTAMVGGSRTTDHARVRDQDVYGCRRQARRASRAVPGSHSSALQEARYDERRLLQAAGRAAQAGHAHLHPGASQPRGCGEELAGVSKRSRMAEGESGHRNAVRPYDEYRVRLCRSNRLLTDEVNR